MSSMDSTEIADSILESCPVYKDRGDLCTGEYFEGDLCNRSCRYLIDAVDKLLEPAKERAELIHGYEL